MVLGWQLTLAAGLFTAAVGMAMNARGAVEMVLAGLKRYFFGPA